MDPITGAVVIAGLTTVGKPTAVALASIVGKILSPSVDAIGEGIAAPLQAWARRRGERAGATLVAAAQMLQKANIEPHAVPGRVLMPILEHASWEQDPALQSKWAALLANAASPGELGKILPAFADILRMLTPLHARVLDWMFAQEQKPDIPSWFSTWPNFERHTVESTFALSSADYALLISDMERMQLVEPYREIKSTPDNIDGDELLKWIMVQVNDREKYRFVAFTALGLRFMRACTPPDSPT
jgi:hypothetical protein